MQNFLDINIATLRQFMVIDGTATRRQFWYFIVFGWLADFGTSILDGFVPGDFLSTLTNIALFVPTLTAAIRRMHDTDRAGWWLLVPIANFVFLISPGTPNRWQKDVSDFDWKG
jgi:uncharacterized membrane protein YhaH (DUF805 family)